MENGMKRISVLLLIIVLTAGCKATLSIGLNKDWSIESHPLNSQIYRPDCKTDLRLSFEKDFSKK
jgi:hypothetical protein